MTVLSDRAIAEHAYAAGFRGQALVTAVAVAIGESAGRTDARGDVGLQTGKWGPSIGLWQIRSLNADHGTGRQRDAKANLDPRTNARHAFQISSGGRDFTPWTVYTERLYLPHLPRARKAAAAAADGRGGSGGGNGRQNGGGKGSSGKAGSRIVLDLKELAKFETLMQTSQHRVSRSLSQVEDVAADLKLTTSTQVHASYLTGLFAAVTGPAGLPLVVRHLEWETHLVQRIRRLAGAVDGDNRRLGPEDLLLYLQSINGRAGLPEIAVLEALTGAGLRTSHRQPARPRDDDRPRVPDRPPLQQMNHGNIVPVHLRHLPNGRLPAGKLVNVGEGERLTAEAAKNFKRMDSAARAYGVDLRVTDGYRTYAEQAYHFDRYNSGRGPLAAAPGTSNHGWGLSVDLDVKGEADALRWLRNNAARYGFFNDVASEPWHWTYRPR